MPRLLALAALGFLVFLSVIGPIAAQSVTQGYGADEVLQRGMVVRLKVDDTTKVVAVSQNEADKMHGVVVDANDAPVTLSSEGQKVFVATNGRFDLLVSDQNGPINTGDYIAMSAINGIGMRAGDKEPVVIGKALASFDGEKGTISTAEIKDSSGNAQKIDIARISADISVSRNPNLRGTEPNLPEFLRRAAEAIADKPVNPVRVYIGVVVFIISTIVAGVILYGGVRSGLISIGRNPLSKKSIIRSMLQVVLFGLIVFVFGLFGVYLLLKI